MFPSSPDGTRRCAPLGHFTSRHFWEVGATDANLLTGWMGRYLDLVGTPDNPPQDLSLDDSLQPSLATARVPVATIERVRVLRARRRRGSKPGAWPTVC